MNAPFGGIFGTLLHALTLSQTIPDICDLLADFSSVWGMSLKCFFKQAMENGSKSAIWILRGVVALYKMVTFLLSKLTL